MSCNKANKSLEYCQSMCRLCSREDLQGNVDLFSMNDQPTAPTTDGNSQADNINILSKLRAAIEKCFGIYIRYDDDLPTKVCSQCFLLMTSWVSLSELVPEVQQMFENYRTDASSEYSDQNFPQPPATEVLYIESTLDDLEVDYIETAVESYSPQLTTEIKEEFEDEVILENGIECEKEDIECGDDDEVKDAEFSEQDDMLVHIDVEQPEEWKCSECAKMFSSQRQFTRHMRTHFSLPLKKTIACPCCDKYFAHSQNVRNHIKYVHMADRPFKCKECHVAVSTKSRLNEHMLTHTDFAPFKCEVCQRGFKNNLRLKRHMEIHDPTKQICPECGLQVTTRGSLNTHMKVHSNELRHKCDQCGRSFKRTASYKYHLMVHTGLKPYSCNFCGRCFATGLNCRLHQQKKHPDDLKTLGTAAGPNTYTLKKASLNELKATVKNAGKLVPAPARRSLKSRSKFK